MQSVVSYEFAQFRLNPDQRTLLRDDSVVSLTPKAFDLLLALVRRSGELMTYAELKQEVWPESQHVEDKTLTQTIYTLRSALGDSSTEQKYIENVPKRGYRFAAKVQVVSSDRDQLDKTSIDDNIDFFGQTLLEPTLIETNLNSTRPELDKGQTVWSRNIILISIAMLVVGVTVGIVIMRRVANSPKDSQASARAERVEIRSPSDEEDVKRVVQESQVYETLTMYTAPKTFDDKDLQKYWLPADLGGKEIKQVEAALARLRSSSTHYGKESRVERFEFRYVRIFSPRDYAEAGTIERWYVPMYREDGSKVLGRNEYLGPYPVDYILRKVNGIWLIEESSTPRPASK